MCVFLFVIFNLYLLSVLIVEKKNCKTYIFSHTYRRVITEVEIYVQIIFDSQRLQIGVKCRN